MGSGASLHKDQETLMNRRLVNPSPVKLEIAAVNAVDHSKFSDRPPPPLPVPASVDFGSKDETFFDSQLHFESDCDDDFHSVKGDFTPSRGNTPVHHRFPAGCPKVNGATVLITERIPISIPPLTSPTDHSRKKRLADFFRDSSGCGDDEEDEVDHALGSSMNAAPNKSTPGSSAYCSSACSSSRTTTTTTSHSQELKLFVSSESRKQGQCCLPVPRLLSRRSFSSEKKNTPPR